MPLITATRHAWHMVPRPPSFVYIEQMAHAHTHSHASHSHAGYGHAHSHAPATFDRAFAIGIALNTAFVVAEIAYGLVAHSLALLADAGHNLSDVLGLALAWGAVWLGRKPATAAFTYGFRRSSILASLVNAVVLLVAVGGIAWEAVQRLANPGPVDSGTVVWVAAAGIAVNGVTAWLFARGSKGDLNIRGAFIHMASDAAISAGVVVAALVTLRTGWRWLDPSVSLVIVVLIIAGTWGLLRESVRLALDGVPAGVDQAGVARYLAALPGVTQVHDLHIWSMSTTEVALTAHLVRPGAGLDDALHARIAHDLEHDHGIAHVTIQCEAANSEHGCQPLCA